MGRPQIFPVPAVEPKVEPEVTQDLPTEDPVDLPTEDEPIDEPIDEPVDEATEPIPDEPMTDETVWEEPDLSSMTKAQLLDYAADQGIEGVSGSMTKANIIAKIEEG